ncbi:MAG TPA: hypothetical protein VM621_10480 [Luteibacter sp.]|uniref:hypothetical protein n=1 Tax=Luteibacter sp. TaxID=1886636 RepID=UPI002C92320A|nr:hypothetical protein [Luteibacter sp.]HVI55465.1 hypothetical protein [Luteibacter sp.]
MVTLIVIAALVAAGIYIRMDFKVRYYREKCENYRELYENEQEDRIDYELELHRTNVQLEDSRQAYSRLIGARAQGWASSTVTRH